MKPTKEVEIKLDFLRFAIDLLSSNTASMGADKDKINQIISTANTLYKYLHDIKNS